MKHLKVLGLVAVAAVAAMALTGVAHATVATSPAQSLYTSTIRAESEGHLSFTGPLGLNIQCSSTLEAKVETHGASLTASGKISSLSFFNCTNAYQVSFLSLGSLEFHTQEGSSNGNGTVTWTGGEWTIKTPNGYSCIYKTSATDIGTLTGSKTTGTTATIDIKGSIPRTGHSALCGTTGEWSGSYKITIPDYLDID